MESFSLLKYWRTTTTSSSATAAAALPAETEDSSSSASSDDDGPFFDLEFAVPDDDDEEGDLEEDFNFSVPADNLPLSPSDDRLFFKGRLGPSPEEPGKHHNGHAHHLSLKSKLLVFALGLRKNQNQSHRQLNGVRPADPTTSPAPAAARRPRHGRFFAVKLDEVPIVSLFAREKPQRPSVDEEDLSRRFSRENLQKYLGKIKPLHHHVRRAQQLAEDSHLPAGLRVVCKHLGKSRSASSAVAAAPPQPPPAVARRRDDSLLQQQDGIQSAIAHCKRSFNGDRGTPTATTSTSAAGDPPLFSPESSKGRILTGTQFAESPDSSLQRSRSDSCDERTTCTDQCMAED